MKLRRAALGLGFVFCLTACSAAHRVPQFPLDTVNNDTAERFKLYLSPDGTIEKFAVYVSKDAIPAWAHALADKTIGAGKDKSFEVEQYADGRKTYEVTRLINGMKAEVSLSATDRTVNYVEKGIDCATLPAPVATAVKAVSGFKADECESKKGDEMYIEVEGTIGSQVHSLMFTVDGQLKSRRKTVPGKLQVSY